MKKDAKIKLKQFFHNYDWKIKIKIITFIFLIFLILFDQLVKLWVRKSLNQEHDYNFLLGFIQLRYVINYGSAFGMNQNKTAFLITIKFLIAFALIIWWTFAKNTTIIFGIIFMLAGTVGNLMDRLIINGGVVDFLKWDIFRSVKFFQTIFNIADILVILGIIIIASYLIIEPLKTLILAKKTKKEGHKKINEKTSTTN